MQVIDVARGIKKLAMQPHTDDHDSHEAHGHEKKHTSLDPHVWTSPANVQVIAKNIYEALAKADPDNQNYYRENLEIFLKQTARTDKQVRSILQGIPKGSKFMVFHPSWGYFAHDYDLVQLPVEVEGKSPKPRELIKLIKEAKAEKIKAIFTQPEFSDAVAKTMAKELGIKVIKVSPMNEHWSENLLNIAQAIAGKE
jgi:zinc transport system substrate-binding protein